MFVVNSGHLVKPGSDWLNDVKTQTDYFPFGMQREDRNDNVAGYRYGYNGKENDNDVKGEGNQQDYGFRIYDPRVARFLSVDPLTADYPWYTPYQFAGNKPVLALDLDGLEELIYKFRFDQRTSGVQLMTTVDTRPESSRSGNPATVQYQYFDQSGKRLSIRRNYQGRYVAGDNEIMPYHTGNYFGSVYIGPNNPVQADGSPDYRYEPRHVVDADALLHDRAYDFFIAKGFTGALFNVETIPADRMLVGGALNATIMAKNKTIDPYTGQPVSTGTALIGGAVGATFTKLLEMKTTLKRMADGAGSIWNSIMSSANSAIESLRSPVKDVEDKGRRENGNSTKRE